MPSIAAPSVPLSQVGRAAHDLGVAGLLGGNLFARIALHPSVTEISDEAERGKVVNAAWRRYGTINTLGLAAVARRLGRRPRGRGRRPAALTRGAHARAGQGRAGGRGRGGGRRLRGAGRALRAQGARRRGAAARRRPHRRRARARTPVARSGVSTSWAARRCSPRPASSPSTRRWTSVRSAARPPVASCPAWGACDARGKITRAAPAPRLRASTDGIRPVPRATRGALPGDPDHGADVRLDDRGGGGDQLVRAAPRHRAGSGRAQDHRGRPSRGVQALRDGLRVPAAQAPGVAGDRRGRPVPVGRHHGERRRGRGGRRGGRGRGAGRRTARWASAI